VLNDSVSEVDQWIVILQMHIFNVCMKDLYTFAT
jgi:hypothetical protein